MSDEHFDIRDTPSELPGVKFNLVYKVKLFETLVKCSLSLNNN